MLLRCSLSLVFISLSTPFLYYSFQPNWTLKYAKKKKMWSISLLSYCQFFTNLLDIISDYSFIMKEFLNLFNWMWLLLNVYSILDPPQNLACTPYVVLTLSFFFLLHSITRLCFTHLQMNPAEQSMWHLVDIHLLSTCWL